MTIRINGAIQLVVPAPVVEAPLPDTIPVVQGSDPTKQVRIEVDGLPPFTTRVWTAPDKDILPDDSSETRGHAVLAGQTGGQTLSGGTVAGEGLNLRGALGGGPGPVGLNDNAKVFDDGDMVVGGTEMVGTERQRVVGDARVEGLVRTNDGDASSPAHSFIGDTDTGALNLAPNVYGVATDGVERIRVDAVGSFGVGTTSIDASAKHQVDSTDKGTIPFTRMTTTQRDAIANPANGLFIYNTTTNVLNFFNGTAWGVV